MAASVGRSADYGWTQSQAVDGPQEAWISGHGQPGRARRVLGPRHHDGIITTDKPDIMWGTDAT
ncbi:hypothetical protein [Myxococcus sp. AB056]|uniref:hypothetical protein n=1 Tax=Myxococcus sp. AB056 TaxID=2562792 RepID=UPI0018913DB7|nr:hypothetical protein [Myxococcus sp. AB056]